MEYSLGRSDHRLEREDFGYDFHDAVLEASKAGHLLKQMIWILHLAQSLPSWLAAALSPSLALVIRTQSVLISLLFLLLHQADENSVSRQ